MEGLLHSTGEHYTNRDSHVCEHEEDEKKTLWRNLEQGWGTNLVVAISNFVCAAGSNIIRS